MKFKQFLTNPDQQIVENHSMIDVDLEVVNNELVAQLSGSFFSPENGIQQIRKVLADYELQMPALYGADPEGEETGLEIEPGLYLYLLYSMNEKGHYEFYAEITDDEGLDELLSHGEDEDIA